MKISIKVEQELKSKKMIGNTISRRTVKEASAEVLDCIFPDEEQGKISETVFTLLETMGIIKSHDCPVPEMRKQKHL